MEVYENLFINYLFSPRSQGKRAFFKFSQAYFFKPMSTGLRTSLRNIIVTPQVELTHDPKFEWQTPLPLGLSFCVSA
jgi:hypothetical protein